MFLFKTLLLNLKVSKLLIVNLKKKKSDFRYILVVLAIASFEHLVLCIVKILTLFIDFFSFFCFLPFKNEKKKRENI